MPADGYEFNLLVVNSISHSFAALTREISSWPLEDKIHIHARACNILYVSISVNEHVKKQLNPYVIQKLSYFLIWSSLAWSLLWAGFTRHTIFRFSSLFFFTMSRNKVWSFSYSSSQVLNTSKQAIMIYNQLKYTLIWPQKWLGKKMNIM